MNWLKLSAMSSFLLVGAMDEKGEGLINFVVSTPFNEICIASKKLYFSKSINLLRKTALEDCYSIISRKIGTGSD